MDIRPDYANEERDGSLCRVDPEEVQVGDVIVIKPGEKAPLDGVVLEGRSSLNTSALTGESLPREVEPGDDVISGCINLNGLIRVQVTKVFGESTVAKILDLVENSSSKKEMCIRDSYHAGNSAAHLRLLQCHRAVRNLLLSKRFPALYRRRNFFAAKAQNTVPA